MRRTLVSVPFVALLLGGTGLMLFLDGLTLYEHRDPSVSTVTTLGLVLGVTTHADTLRNFQLLGGLGTAAGAGCVLIWWLQKRVEQDSDRR